MNRMRFRRDIRGILLFVAVSLVCGPFLNRLRADDSNQQFRAHLRVILRDGINRRGSLGEVRKHVDAARRLRPDDPVVDYSHGLVLLSRSQYSQAARRFQTVTQKHPDYLPAWQALLVLRVDRKQRRQLTAELTALADVIAGTTAKWANDADRKTAAKFVGRLIEFLEFRDVDLLKAKPLRSLRTTVEKRLSPQFSAEFAAGRAQLMSDRRQLERQIGKSLDDRTERRQREAAKTISEVGAREKKLDKQTESLNQTAAQWKAWIDDQLEANGKQLAELRKDYEILESADAKLSRMALQATIDAGRLQTDYQRRGLRPAVAATQASVVRLRQEAERYSSERGVLKRQAARVIVNARMLFVSRSAAIQKYKQATGEIVREANSVTRWQNHLKRSALHAKVKSATLVDPYSLRRRLTRVESYFPFDCKTEARRLLDTEKTVKTPKTAKSSQAVILR